MYSCTQTHPTGALTRPTPTVNSSDTCHGKLDHRQTGTLDDGIVPCFPHHIQLYLKSKGYANPQPMQGSERLDIFNDKKNLGTPPTYSIAPVPTLGKQEGAGYKSGVWLTSITKVPGIFNVLQETQRTALDSSDVGNVCYTV